MTRTLRAAIGWPLWVQVGWALLAMAWNVAGVLLIARGLRSPGPTASWTTAAVLLALAAALLVAIGRAPVVYLLLSVAAGLMGLAAVVNAFTVDPALWPSELWRWAGAALNGVGFLAAVTAVVRYFRWATNE